MNQGQTVFSQIMDHLPLSDFHKCVSKYQGDHRIKNFSCLDQFLCMSFAQLTYRESLRDIESCLRSQSSKGVTGYHTLFSKQFEAYLRRAKKATQLPLGVGFGVQTKEDIDHLKGKVDIAIVCTQTIKVATEKGAVAAGEFLRQLR